MFFSFGPVDKIVIDTILYYFLLFYVACSHTVNHTVFDNVEQAMFYTVKTYGFLYLPDYPSVDKTLPGWFSPGSTKNDTCQK